jgi:hypothetical protein
LGLVVLALMLAALGVRQLVLTRSG